MNVLRCLKKRHAQKMFNHAIATVNQQPMIMAFGLNQCRRCDWNHNLPLCDYSRKYILCYTYQNFNSLGD